jgi:hypothetical protein
VIGTVQAGYEPLAPRSGEWMANIEGDPWERFVEELASRLPGGARVLDLGCGNGPELFARILRWLKPDGLFLASLSRVGGPDRTEEWLGVPMFFSGFDADTNRRRAREAGFELLVDELICMTEPEDVESGWLWVLAQRPA